MTLYLRQTLSACVALPFLAGAILADSSRGADLFGWRDDFIARLEAVALLETLNADLLSHDSATLTLERWCENHKLASAAKIIAEQVHAVDKAPTAEQRRELRVHESEPIRYRRVRLHCGDHVLSEADNWYVPSRLTPDMNYQLDTTNTPFGRVVQACISHATRFRHNCFGCRSHKGGRAAQRCRAQVRERCKYRLT
jgi:chorismate-pyruvate lyase